jgi:hypothetical protein
MIPIFIDIFNLLVIINLAALASENRLFLPFIFNDLAALGLFAPVGHEVAINSPQVSANWPINDHSLLSATAMRLQCNTEEFFRQTIYTSRRGIPQPSAFGPLYTALCLLPTVLFCTDPLYRSAVFPASLC